MDARPETDAAPHPRADVGHPEVVGVAPALDAGERDFLAGFAPTGGGTRRLWPGQPRHASPWRPCARGCCLLLTGRHLPPGLAGDWLRWLEHTFLDDRALDGVVTVPVRGGAVEVVIAEAGDIFEGLVDPPDDDDPEGGWSA